LKVFGKQSLAFGVFGTGVLLDYKLFGFGMGGILPCVSKDRSVWFGLVWFGGSREGMGEVPCLSINAFWHITL
jgi:hypothetical protein